MAEHVIFGDFDDEMETRLAVSSTAPDRSPSHVESAIRAMRAGVTPEVAMIMFQVALTPAEMGEFRARPRPG